MKFSLWNHWPFLLGIASLAKAQKDAAFSPFAWQEPYPLVSPYAKTGQFEQLGRSGISAMHAVLINESSILIIDKAEWNEAKLGADQYAFSVLYNTEIDEFTPLPLESNPYCSAGGFLANGTFISVGGGDRRGGQWKASDGSRAIRHFGPCSDENCEWHEFEGNQLTTSRWYPTVEQLPEGDLLIVGGSVTLTAVNRDAINSPSFEFWPPRSDNFTELEFLKDTLPYNLYPLVFTLPDGNVFLFANNRSIIFDYNNNRIVKRLPDIEGVPRSYPLTGGGVLLPLDPDNNYNAEILICGGSERTDKNSPADATCARINLGDKDPQWEMDDFIHPRLMPDGVILADGSVLWANGCKRGWAGYNDRNFDPTFDPLIYHPEKKFGHRWDTHLANTDIARMYNSVAITLPDGRVWIAGSNNNNPSDLTTEYPTEFRVEYFSPPYLFQSQGRPLVSRVPRVVTYGQTIVAFLNLNDIVPTGHTPEMKVGLLRQGFSTHSLHMSQRYVFLRSKVASDLLSITIEFPPNANIFPPGPGYLYVLCDGVPSKGVEIIMKHNMET